MDYLTPLRIGLFDEERELIDSWMGFFDDNRLIMPLSQRNELLVMKELKSHAHKVLDEYPTTLEGDKLRLET